MCAVTQKLDLDQMSKRSIRTLKDHTVDKTHFCVQTLGLFASYDPVWDNFDDTCGLISKMESTEFLIASLDVTNVC